MNTVGNSRKNDVFEIECVEFFAEAVHVFGVPKSIGQIYGLLFASPSALSFSDIVARLDISKGSISQGLQFLRTLGAIKIATVGRTSTVFNSDNSRRDYYEPELSLRKLMNGVLRERFEPLIERGDARLGRLRRLGKEGGGRGPFCLKRIKQLETWRTQLRLTLPILRAVLGPPDS